jgi:tRNA A-37 threonylcarbamoyl transferase component Bud32
MTLAEQSPGMIEVGQTIGNYRVLELIGEGGMGIVYLVEHPVIGRRGALKAVHPSFALDVDVVARFTNEARAISQIGHEHIVDVTDFGRTEAGDFYFIMEFLRGESLCDRIAREAPLSPPRALAIAAQVADALAASHEHGVVHRDLKPENVFLVPRTGTRDFVKVLDFGLAKLASDAVADAPADVVMGTPHYMAPEQCEGLPTIDARADVYALGVLLFEMVTGRVPFVGDTATEILQKQVSAKPPTARSLVSILPEAIDRIIQKALAKDPADRFASMADMRVALRAPVGVAAAPGVRGDTALERRPAWLGVSGSATDQVSEDRTTLRGGVGAVEADPAALDLVPARAWAPRRIALVTATFAALAFMVGLGARHPPAAALVAAASGGPAVEAVAASPRQGARAAVPSGAPDLAPREPARAGAHAVALPATRGVHRLARPRPPVAPRRLDRNDDPDGDDVLAPFTQ